MMRTSPLMVQLEEEEDTAAVGVGKETTMLRKVSIAQPPPIPEKEWLGDEWRKKTCLPMHKWQLPQYGPSTCVTLHEASVFDMEFIDCGGSRCAFRIQDGQGQPIVLKTPKFKDEHYTPANVEAGWMDTIAMERLSSSPFVLNIYGNCGVAQFIEMGQSSLHDLIKLARAKRQDSMSSMDKLRINFQLASGIADVHSIDGHDVPPSLAHNDLDPGQIILVDGVYKVQDFHLSSIKYEDRKGQTCREPPKNLRSWLNKMRAPEELLGLYIHRDRVDVWCLGDMMYNVLTKRWMFEGVSAKHAKASILSGKRPLFPPRLKNTTDVFEQAMIKAIQMAWTYNPDDRPSAREIANFLKRYLDQKDGGAFWRVSIPPLPPNYRHTDSDFMANFAH